MIRGKILKWGNSAGLRISREDLRESGLHIGQEATFRLEDKDGKVDLTGLPTFRSPDGRTDVSINHDEILAEAFDEKRQKRDRDARRRH